MAVTYLLDTSIITRLRNADIGIAVADLASEHAIARTTMTDLEIGFSARSGSEWDRLLGALEAFAPVEIEPRHFQRARQVQRQLAERGLRGRKVPDLLIAAAAELGTMTMLHYDGDFDHIADVTGQPSQWIIPPGTID